MADLTFSEKHQLEKLFAMSSGYVLNFSDRTFRAFIDDSVGEDITQQKYKFSSCSKANLLRQFWKIQSNRLVGKLISDMISYAETLDPSYTSNEKLLAYCKGLAERLLQDASVENIAAITPNRPGRGFDACAKAAREAIQNNEPEVGLDRLHTFLTAYVRTICANHSISVDQDEPLNSIFGKYVRYLKQQGLLEATMTEQILRSSIGTLEKFNAVRNNQSLAHDNVILNHHESLLIFEHVASSVRFLEFIESRSQNEQGSCSQS